jgi:hypothetical protein
VPRVLFVPEAKSVTIIDKIPVTLEERLELLAERRRLLMTALTLQVPPALRPFMVDDDAVLEGVDAYAFEEEFAQKLDASFGTIVKLVLRNDGARSAGATATPDPWQWDAIGLAPSRRPACGQGVVVGIADSWLFDTHNGIPKAAAMKAFDEQGREIIDPDIVMSGHGTAVASLIGGAVIGVAPASTIVFASVLRQESGTIAGHFEGTAIQVAEGLDYLSKTSVTLANGSAEPVRIINASFHVDPGQPGGDKLQHIVDALFQSGILLFAGTGNTGNNQVCYPARLTDAFGIGALNRKGHPWPDTATGTSKPDLWAPGVVHACSTGNAYQFWEGTSMASAIAAGCAAAALSTTPALKAPALRRRMFEWANSIPGGKRIDLAELP